MTSLRYIIPRPILDDFLKRARASCHECVHKKEFPKKPLDTPIISSSFGERILVDLKTLPKYGYMIVAVCHWSDYCCLGHLATKAGDGVAKFLGEVVFPDIDQIRDSWKTTHEESQAARIGGLSFPNPYSDLVDTGVSDAVTNLHVMGGIQDHEVQVGLSPLTTQFPGSSAFECSMTFGVAFQAPRRYMRLVPEPAEKWRGKPSPTRCKQADVPTSSAFVHFHLQRDLATGLKTGRTQVLQHDRGADTG